MTRREYESRRITRLHNEWLAKRGLPARNTFNRWEKVKTDDIRISNDVRGGCSLQ